MSPGSPGSPGSELPRVTCVALSGGVGGAKLIAGRARVLVPSALLVVANTGDDFEHLGLHVSPDLDTLTYTLAGLNDLETGWGRAGETLSFMAALEALGGETWFRLGDGDLATHVERTRRLAAGESLSEIAARFGARLGIAARIVPMSDDPVRTIVRTPEGALAFQHYFVRLRCEPEVSGFEYAGAEVARANPALLEALDDPALEAIVICPSNPFISIDPILALPQVKAKIRAAAAPAIAVSPIVGGRSLKGPTAKMMRELKLAENAAAIARHYGDVLDGYVIDRQDGAIEEEVRALGLEVLVSDTVMTGAADQVALARAVLGFAEACRQA
ncbi:MAG: 2-phospho-L-lactate transferase [Alphaproteobacteria bacterium]|nr:2-phospho-L-lactate transferase [Alphaproteobacteria bacterium]